MRFSIFIPHGLDAGEKAPMLYYLSGLTCTDENFCQKASNAFEAAAEYKIAIVVPDTSPRGANIPGWTCCSSRKSLLSLVITA